MRAAPSALLVRRTVLAGALACGDMIELFCAADPCASPVVEMPPMATLMLRLVKWAAILLMFAADSAEVRACSSRKSLWHACCLCDLVVR
jgi:hypothetical protein